MMVGPRCRSNRSNIVSNDEQVVRFHSPMKEVLISLTGMQEGIRLIHCG